MLKEKLTRFLFCVDRGNWLTVLRIGLALQLIFYLWSLRYDWNSLFGVGSSSLINRQLSEAVLSGESIYTPRLGWIISAGKAAGLSEAGCLTAVWYLLTAASLSLLAGVMLRPVTVLAWFLYLCSVKSGGLFTYGVDNFTTIGLFYLMIAPLPDRWSFDSIVRRVSSGRIGYLCLHKRLLQCHLTLAYFSSGLAKSLSSDWWNGTSIWRALTRPPFDVLSPEFILRFQPLLPLLGISALSLELLYPLFIWWRRSRPFWLAGILAMHITIGVAMDLRLFAFVMVILNLSAFGIDVIARRVRNFPPAIYIRRRLNLLT